MPPVASHSFVQLRQYAGVYTGRCITAYTSRRYPVSLLKADYPCSSSGILYEEALGVDREPYTNAAVRVPGCCEV